MTPAQRKIIDQAAREFHSSTRVLQPEKHYPEGHDIKLKVVKFLHIDHPYFSTLDLHWTESEDQYDFPRKPDQFTRPNEDLEKWWIARVEPYVDPEGKTK